MLLLNAQAIIARFLTAKVRMVLFAATALANAGCGEVATELSKAISGQEAVFQNSEEQVRETEEPVSEDEKRPLPAADLTKADVLIGFWVRVDDVYAGTIMEIAKAEGILTGTLLHVDPGLVEYGFRTGHQKLRNFRVTSPGKVLIESRVHNVNGFSGELRSWYDEGTAEFSKDEFFWRQAQYEDRKGGEWQRWKRIDENSEHAVNLIRGIAALAAQRADWDKALTYYEKALKLERSAFNLNEVAWWLAVVPDKGLRDPQRAIALAEEACKATNFRSSSYLDTLASAYAADKQWENAVRYQIQACRQLTEIDEEYFMRLAWFREATPYVHGMSREVDVEEILAGLNNTAVGGSN